MPGAYKNVKGDTYISSWIPSYAERGPVVWDQYHRAALADGKMEEGVEMVTLHIQGAEAAFLKAIDSLPAG